MASTVYLIPTILSEGKTDCLPGYILEAVKKCNALFVENERTARRYLKLLSKDIVIDDFAWYNMKEIDSEIESAFIKYCTEEKTIGIISEAGCPGIADPGQLLVEIAQRKNVIIKPLVGPNSILLALMGSGMNGQQFSFHGYLPIDNSDRIKTIKQLENESKQRNQTQIFIETPYRNNQLMEAMVKTCNAKTRICVAVDLTSDNEMIKTKTAGEWKSNLPEIHKRPAIFLMQVD